MAARGISNIIFSETTCLVEFLLGRNVPYMTFCRFCEFTDVLFITYTDHCKQKKLLFFSGYGTYLQKKPRVMPVLVQLQRKCLCLSGPLWHLMGKRKNVKGMLGIFVYLLMRNWNTTAMMVYRESHSGQTKDYKIGICCFCAKHAALRIKRKDWLTWN